MRITGIALAIGLLLAGTPARATLYDDLGGQTGVNGIVDQLLAISLADPRIKQIFAESNIPRLKLKLAEHLCFLTQGPCVYKGMSMEAAHKGLHLHEADFLALVENLQTAMDRNDVPFPTQNRLLAILAPMERRIVTR